VLNNEVESGKIDWLFGHGSVAQRLRVFSASDVLVQKFDGRLALVASQRAADLASRLKRDEIGMLGEKLVNFTAHLCVCVCVRACVLCTRAVPERVIDGAPLIKMLPAVFCRRGRRRRRPAPTAVIADGVHPKRAQNQNTLLSVGGRTLQYPRQMLSRLLRPHLNGPLVGRSSRRFAGVSVSVIKEKLVKGLETDVVTVQDTSGGM
jgi:hypothetical protein